MLKHVRFLYALLVITAIASLFTYYIVQKGQDLFFSVDSSYTIQASRLSQKEIQKHLWKNFSYENKPIYPKCLLDLIGTKGNPKSSSVDLDKCSVYDQDQETQDGNLDDVVFKYTFPVKGSSSNGEVSYTPFTQSHNKFFLVYTINTGGNSYYSTIVSVDKIDNTLQNPEVISPVGDRCNGGITAVAVLSGSNTFMYRKYLTPIDIVKEGDINTKLKPIEDLEASASSCFGQEYTKYNISKKNSYFGFVQLLNSTPVTDQPGWTDMYKYQSCFNTVFNSYGDANKNTLDKNGLNTFYNDFINQCFK